AGTGECERHGDGRAAEGLGARRRGQDPADGRATVVAHDVDGRGDSERVQDSDDVGHDALDAIEGNVAPRVRVTRSRRVTEPAEIRRDHAITGVGYWADLLSPHFRRVGEPVEEQHWIAV